MVRQWIVPRSLPNDPLWLAAYVRTASGWGEDADHSLHPLSVEETISSWQDVLKSPAWVDQRTASLEQSRYAMQKATRTRRRPRRTGLPPPSISAGSRKWSPTILSGSKGWQRPRNTLPAQRMLHPTRTTPRRSSPMHRRLRTRSVRATLSRPGTRAFPQIRRMKRHGRTEGRTTWNSIHPHPLPLSQKAREESHAHPWPLSQRARGDVPCSPNPIAQSGR